MFKIDPDPKFWAEVKVRAPGGGDASFKARFRVRNIDDFNGFDTDSPEATGRFLGETIVDLDDIEGEDGRAAAFSTELLRRLIGMPHVRAALYRAYVNAIAEAARGN